MARLKLNFSLPLHFIAMRIEELAQGEKGYSAILTCL
jgi:hypothetical protein